MIGASLVSALSDEGFPSTTGAIHRVRLCLGLSDCEIVIETDVKISWMSGEYARGFRFIGMSSDKARILDHFIESGIEGEAAIVGGLALNQRSGSLVS